MEVFTPQTRWDHVSALLASPLYSPTSSASLVKNAVIKEQRSGSRFAEAGINPLQFS